MKTVLSHEFIYNQDNSNNNYQNTKINQSVFINKIIRTDISYDRKFRENVFDEVIMLKVNYYF